MSWFQQRRRLAVFAGVCVLLASPALAQNTDASRQSLPDPRPCSSTQAPCAPKPSTSQAVPSAADRFPFPGSASPNTPGESRTGDGASTGPAAPVPAAQPTGAAQRFPFPGEGPSTATDAPSAPTAPGDSAVTPAAGVGSSSSSSSSDNGNPDPFGDAGSPDLKDAGTEGSQTRPGGHILHRAAPPAAKPQTADEREQEDLRVANFNLDSGNVPGAYMRARDAVKTAPDDPEAHFALAAMADKLGKKEEAIAEYKACLGLDPTDERKKQSNKALERLANSRVQGQYLQKTR